MVAKVIPPKKKLFYLIHDQEINESEGVSRLSNEFRKSLDDIGIFGRTNGFHIVSLTGQQGSASIDVFKSKIKFWGSDEDGWVGMEFLRKPSAVIFGDGTRIEAITKREMDAELAARQKPSRKEK